MIKRKPVVLAIIDGFGIAPDSQYNAITQAKTSNIDRFIRDYPVLSLYASGIDIGCASDAPSNAEIGHVNIGAGRVWHSTQSYIDTSIAQGTFFENHVLQEACRYTKEHTSTMHMIGLLSTANIHSRIKHCYALLDMAKKYHIKNVAVHVILDGIDAPHDAGKALVVDLLAYMKKNNIGYIASISGRFFAMDRDHYWNRTEKAYRAIMEGHAEFKIDDPLVYIEQCYAQGISDADIIPAVITHQGIQKNDSIIFFNSRADGMRQIVESMVLPSCTHFERDYLSDIYVVTMRDYEAEIPVRVAFPGRIVHNSLADVLSKAGKTQYHIADTERYPHVTYFFNGYISEMHDGEVQKMITFSDGAYHDKKLLMHIKAIAKEVIKAVESGEYDFIVCNFSHIDIYAHIADLNATKKVISAIDKALGSIAEYVLAEDGILCMTASHGSAEYMSKDKKQYTNINPVPCILVGEEFFGRVSRAGDPPDGDMSLLHPVGRLADIAPTILKIMGIEKPDEMSGKSLFR